MSKNKFAVIFACDHNYIWPALLAANSIAAHAKTKNFDIRIFSCTHIPDGFTDHCSDGVTAEVLSMGDFTVKTNITDRYSMATFARLFALKKIEREYDRILYLDADIAVRHGDVNVLWTADMDGKAAAAVRDCLGWGRVKRNYAKYLTGLGLAPDHDMYFNSGCLLVNCPAWADQEISDQVWTFLDENPELCIIHDQSALNAVLARNCAEISFLWNWQLSEFRHSLLIPTRDPHVVHFNSRRKPWRDGQRLLSSEFRVPLLKLANDVGWNGFHSRKHDGRMGPRKERLRAEFMAKLYAGLPAYLPSINTYLSRTDFIDFNEPNIGE